MATKNDSKKNDGNGNGGKAGAWKLPSKEDFDAAMKVVQTAETKVVKAQAELDRARQAVSIAVIDFLEKYGKAGESEGEEKTFPKVHSSLLGGEIQPVIRRTKDDDGEVVRTAFLKRFGNAKDIPSF